MEERLLSVIIPTYDREIDIIKRAIVSVKNQTYPHIEIIVVDDNPNDSLLSMQLQSYCLSQKVIYLKQYGNKGACEARNLGVANSSGYYIAFLDDDDEWLPTKAREQIYFFSKGYDLIFCKGLNIYTKNSPPVEKAYGNSVNFIKTPTFQDLLIKNCIGTTSQIMVTRECFYEINGFDPKFLARQDYDFCLRVSEKCKIYGVDSVLFKHYIHSEAQISANPDKALQGYKLLFHKYKQSYKTNEIAYINICCKIAKSYLHKKKYWGWLIFVIRSLLKNPIKLHYIICKSCEKKII